ncbi:YlbF family regulator [Lactobacillus helveticus]|uniref:UPF0342 protein GDZ32_08915 n=1 Tax=Lactobacillus helveticus TaxID=1587 RepID=A0A6A7K355_LACHE|nr:YlbF family regulator [Lactobacillus helveticus]MPW14945.1 YlbF family regulator [Lactobacillus helveticus]
MINIYDSANQLAQDLTKTDQYKAVGDAVNAVQADDESAALFKKMDEIQAKIMQAQQTGKPLSDEDQKAYKELNAQVQKNDKIVALLKSEQGLYDLLGEIQKAYTKPINDLYEGLRN